MSIRNELLSNLTTALPEGISTGFRAVTTQSYVEANVKNGAQWEVGLYDPVFPSLAVNDVVIITGSVPIVLKGRALRFDGLGLMTSTFEAPAYSGGTPIPFYNLNHRNQATPEIQILGGTTVTDDGVQLSANKYFLGSDAVGNTITSSEGFEAQGAEFIFAANTTYLFKITSIDDTSTQRVFSYVTWYEGDTDLPLGG